MADNNEAKKKSSGAGKFFLGAALGAIAGAVAGKAVSAKMQKYKSDGGEALDDLCDCGPDCDCKPECKCDKKTSSDKKVEKTEKVAKTEKKETGKSEKKAEK